MSTRRTLSVNHTGMLNLEQLRKQAKELLRDWQAGTPDAIARVRALLPPDHRSLAAAPGPKLADAQFAIARAAGFESWPRLKAQAESLASATRRIAAADPARAPDADPRLATTHIRCGSDLPLAAAGFVGRYVEFADPYCQGPVPENLDDDALLAVRSAWIADAYALPPGGEAPADRGHRELAAVQAAIAHADRLVLWFEHDSYDQLILARLLALLADAPRRPAHVELICIRDFPGVDRFIGLGQLCREALDLLWAERRPITAAQLDLGRRAWRALRSPDPRPLAALVATGTPALPIMAPALRRHLEELPWVGDGLSRTQRQTLQALADAPKGGLRGAALFVHATQTLEPLCYLGDAMYAYDLRQLASADAPLLEALPPPADGAIPADAPWHRQYYRLSDRGRALLAGQLDASATGLAPRWVGGVQVDLSRPHWRWSPDKAAPIHLAT